MQSIRPRRARRERGVGLAMLGRTDEALECLRRAAALEPGEPKNDVHEAVALARLERFDEAIAALDGGLAGARSGRCSCARGFPVDGRPAGRSPALLRGRSRGRSGARGQLGLQGGHRVQARSPPGGDRVDPALPGGQARGARRSGWTPRAGSCGRSCIPARSATACARSMPEPGAERSLAGAFEGARALRPGRRGRPALRRGLVQPGHLSSSSIALRRGGGVAREGGGTGTGPRASWRTGSPRLLRPRARGIRLAAVPTAWRRRRRGDSRRAPRRGAARRASARAARPPGEALPLYERLLARAPEDAELAREHAEALRAAAARGRWSGHDADPPGAKP